MTAFVGIFPPFGILARFGGSEGGAKSRWWSRCAPGTSAARPRAKGATPVRIWRFQLLPMYTTALNWAPCGKWSGA